MNTAAATITSKLNYLAASRGCDDDVAYNVAEARRKLVQGDMPMAREYLRCALRAWEASTGYVTRRGELARWAAAA